jgi:hypothetical protein
MNSKHETIEDNHAFYAFVDLKPDAPVTYIVPSHVVADVLRKNHEGWLAAPGTKGQPHVDNPVRKFRPTYNPPVPGWGPAELEQYRERWDFLHDVVTD